MYTIDLNSDMGESFGAYRIGNDEGTTGCSAPTPFRRALRR